MVLTNLQHILQIYYNLLLSNPSFGPLVIFPNVQSLGGTVIVLLVCGRSVLSSLVFAGIVGTPTEWAPFKRLEPRLYES